MLYSRHITLDLLDVPDILDAFDKGSPFLKFVVSIWALPVNMVWSTFFVHSNGQFLVLGGSKQLPGWLVHFLAHFGDVKKQM